MSRITIGSDVEFAVLCGDSLQSAIDILSSVFDLNSICCECSLSENNEVYQREIPKYIRKVLEEIYTTPELALNFPEGASIVLPGYVPDADKLMLNKTINNEVRKRLKRNGYDSIEDFNNEDNKIKLEVITDILLYDIGRSNGLREIIKSIYKFFNINDSGMLIDVILDLLSPEGVYPSIDELRIDLPREAYLSLVEVTRDRFRFIGTGCDNCKTNPENYLCITDIGCDNETMIGELRPKFEYRPIDHFRNIRDLIKKFYLKVYNSNVCKENINISVLGGSLVEGYKTDNKDSDIRVSLGGHIHIGYVDLLQDNIYDNSFRTVVNKISYRIVSDILSLYAGVPMFLIEKIGDALSRRVETDYGRFSSYSAKGYGIEWRMPSSWIVSPEITMSCLSLAYIVSNEIVKSIIQNSKRIGNINNLARILEDKLLNEEKIIRIIEDSIELVNKKLYEQRNIENIEDKIDINNIKYVLYYLILINLKTDFQKLRTSNKLPRPGLTYIKNIQKAFDKNLLKERYLYDIDEWILEISYTLSKQIEKEINNLLIAEFTKNSIIPENIYIVLDKIKETFDKLMFPHLYTKKPEFISKIFEESIDILRTHALTDIQDFVQRTELYNDYKDYIDIIFEMITNKETWPTDDIMPRWKQLWT